MLGLATIVLSPVLPFIFTSDSAVRHEATRALVICGAQQPFAALAFVYDGLLLGAGDYRTLRRAMLFALLAFAPLAIATLAHPELGIVGIWLALTCWLAARTVLLGRRWAGRKWAPGMPSRDGETDPARRDVDGLEPHGNLLAEG